MSSYPKVVSVRAVGTLRLAVTFENGAERFYDCAPLLSRPAFRPLADPLLFRAVFADPNGFGVVWSDELDLAESELWLNGTSIES